MIIQVKRGLVAACLVLISFIPTPANAQAKRKNVASADTINPIKSLVSFATRHINIPYRSGGTSKKGFDCSGFVRYCFDKWNVALPHSSEAQSKQGNVIRLPEAKPGDLIFFKGNSTKTSRIGHVGIITEVSPAYVRFIHSAWNGGVRYDLLSASYYQKRFVAIRRMID